MTLTEKVAQTTGTLTAPTTDPRIDRVVIDNTTGVVSVITGVEAASPVPPALTAGKLPVCQVALAVSQTQILNADITDERAFPLKSGGDFSSGDRLLFQQTTAPVGYTKETDSAFNDVALRIVTGTAGSGGATAFTSVFGASKVTGGHTVTISEMPAHDHNLAASTTGSGFASTGSTDGSSINGSMNTETIGGGGSHDHTLSLDLKYRDVIIAEKD